MVEQTINVATQIIPFDPVEAVTQVNSAKVDVQKIDVKPRRGALPNEELYDWILSSSGVDGLGPVDVHHKSLRFTPDPDVKLAIPSFFTGTIEDATSKLNAFVRLNYNSDIDLDVFFSYAAAVGAVTWDAYFYVVDSPPSNLSTPFPDIPSNFSHYEAIQLYATGDKRIRYLIVGLALP